MEKLNTANTDEKESLLISLNKSLEYFQPFIAWNKEISNLLGWKEYYSNLYNISISTPTKYARGLFISISFIVLVSFSWIPPLLGVEIPFFNFYTWSTLLALSICSAVLINANMKKAKLHARQIWYQQYLNNDVYPKIKFTYKQMNDYYNAYNDSGNQVVPFFYAHPDDISKLIFYINTGRADTIKEAINCYVADQQAQQMMQQQMQIQQTVNGALYYAKKSANSARVAAIASTIDLFLR